MNPKVARFFPLAVVGLVVLREITLIVFAYEFQIVYYFEDLFLYNGLIISIFAFLFKLAGILIFLATFKFLSDGNIRLAKLFAMISFAFLILRGLSTLIFGVGSYYSTISNILAAVIILATIANLVIVLLVRDPASPARNPRINATMATPVPFNPPVQSYSAQGTQSVPDQISALEKLHSAGTLTDAEFKAAKKKILE